MTNFIEEIEITNFKSIESCHIKDCKRINLFLGKPNVGKSNILEALSLFSVPFLKENSSKNLSNLIRVENEAELFYNGNINDHSVIRTPLGSCDLAYQVKTGLSLEINFNEPSEENKDSKFTFAEFIKFAINDKLIVKQTASLLGDFESPIKRYNFNQNIIHKKGHAKYLIPPFGYNLLSIIENYKELKNQVTSLFHEYGLEVAFDKASQTIKIIQSQKDGIFLIPYNSIADTLQRIIFFKAAIASNENSVLLFEEPEAHSFPPYMAHITQEMIHKKSNQFFVATHSPFILNDLLENGRDELAVFLVNYNDHKTQIKNLSKDELDAVFQNGVDLFTNNESFF